MKQKEPDEDVKRMIEEIDNIRGEIQNNNTKDINVAFVEVMLDKIDKALTTISTQHKKDIAVNRSEVYDKMNDLVKEKDKQIREIEKNKRDLQLELLGRPITMQQWRERYLKIKELEGEIDFRDKTIIGHEKIISKQKRDNIQLKSLFQKRDEEIKGLNKIKEFAEWNIRVKDKEIDEVYNLVNEVIVWYDNEGRCKSEWQERINLLKQKHLHHDKDKEVEK